MRKFIIAKKFGAKLAVLSAIGFGLLGLSGAAHAEAEAWASAFSTFMSGAGMDSVQAWLGAAVLVIGALYVFRKVAGR
jgi:hypothetical protein